jgi:hypothetical protein
LAFAPPSLGLQAAQDWRGLCGWHVHKGITYNIFIVYPNVVLDADILGSGLALHAEQCCRAPLKMVFLSQCLTNGGVAALFCDAH